MTDKQTRMVTVVRDAIGDRDNRTDLFTIQYSGTASTVTMTVDQGTMVTTVDGTDDVEVILSEYSDLYELVNYLNTQGYEVELVGEDGSFDPLDILPIYDVSILKEPYTVKSRHWFPDSQILRWVEDFVSRSLQGYTSENVEDEDEVYVGLNAALHGCTILMANASKYYAFSIDGFSGSRSMLANNYQLLYNNIRDRIGVIGYTMQQGQLVRKSNLTGNLTPASQVYRVIPVKLISADVSNSDVTLTWGQSLAENFYCYEIWVNDGDGYVFNSAEYNRHTRSAVVTLADGDYTVKLRTVATVALPAGLQYPATAPSESRYFADSNELTVEV